MAIELKPQRYTHSRKTSLNDSQNELLQRFIDKAGVTESHAVRYILVNFLENHFNSVELNSSDIIDSQPRRGRKKKGTKRE